MYNHGIKIAEQETSIVTPIEGTAGLQVVFGTAPINRLSDPESAVNKPIIAYSFKEAVSKLGYSDDFKKYTLCQSMDATFRVFNVAPIIFVNVLDPNVHKKDITDAELKLVGSKAIIECNDVLLDTIKLKADDTDLEKNIDYTIGFDSDYNVAINVLATDKTDGKTILKVSYSAIDATMVDKNDVIGGYNALTDQETGLELIRVIYPKLGLTPGIILAPGWSHDPEVAAVMQAKCESINSLFTCECIVDIDSANGKATTYDKVKEEKEALGADSKHTIVCWPKVKVGEKQYYYSAMMGALIAYTDANNRDIPNLSPSNKALRVTGTILEDGAEVNLDLEQANLVNSFGVCTAINMNGWKSWGNNTAIYPSSTDPKDRWIGVRRFFSWWGNTFILTYFQKADSNTDTRLIESIVDSENIRCNSYQARGIIAGGRIEFKSNENPITDILNGTIKFHQYLAPFTPAEYIVNTLEFDPSMIEETLKEGDI